MTNEELIQRLIRGSRQRAIQESIAAVIVLAAFGAILQNCETGSLRFYGCLTILIGTGFIAGVVWSFALSSELLRSHPASESSFWRETFRSQARLLCWAPAWYAAPICLGGMLFVTPARPDEWIPSLIVMATFAAVFAGLTWLNRRAAVCLEQQSALLVP